MITGMFTPNAGAPGPTPGFGLLRVTTNPAVPAQVRVNGVPMNDWDLGWLKLAPGTYTVTFGGIKDYTTPAPQVVTVSADQVTTVVGNFGQRGWLRVVTSPAAQGTIFINGLPRQDWATWTSFPPGSYTVCYGPAPGFSVTPPCETKAVNVWQLTTFTGTYSNGP
jgi:hypothetical protein